MTALFGQKTFRGRDIADAMRQVKAEFGADACIIDKREVPAKKSLFKLTGEPMVEIVAAGADYRIEGAAEKRAHPAGGASLLEKTYGQATVPVHAEGVQVELSRGRYGQPAAAPASAAPPAAAESAFAGNEMLSAVRAAVQAEMHNEMIRLTSNFACGGVPPVGERFLDIYNRLLENGVDSAIAREIAIKLQCELGHTAVLNEQVLENTLRQLIAGEFRVRPPEPEEAHHPKIITLVGPAGGGKTTTVVKLAFAAFSRQKNVGLITEDFNRPGAEAQLRALIQLMSLPLATVDSPARMAEEIRNLQNMDIILIDTAGRGVRDHKGLDDLHANLDAASPHETHLVLPATLSGSSALAIADAYRICKYNRVLISKLDEAVNFGLLLNLARKIPEPFSYLALGQAFRNGFVDAETQALANLVMGDDRLLSPEPVR